MYTWEHCCILVWVHPCTALWGPSHRPIIIFFYTFDTIKWSLTKLMNKKINFTIIFLLCFFLNILAKRLCRLKMLFIPIKGKAMQNTNFNYLKFKNLVKKQFTKKQRARFCLHLKLLYKSKIHLSGLIVALLAGNKSGDGLLNFVALGYRNWKTDRPKQVGNYLFCKLK